MGDECDLWESGVGMPVLGDASKGVFVCDAVKSAGKWFAELLYPPPMAIGNAFIGRGSKGVWVLESVASYSEGAGVTGPDAMPDAELPRGR